MFEDMIHYSWLDKYICNAGWLGGSLAIICKCGWRKGSV
jgi:hypothetical protein